MKKIRLVDLFNGTGSVKKAAALDTDFDCFSLDSSNKCNQPDLLVEIHDWTYKEMSKWSFDIIVASVPDVQLCTHTCNYPT